MRPPRKFLWYVEGLNALRHKVGDYLGISHVTLSHRVEEGDLRAVRIGKRVLIPESAASDWLNRHTVNAAAGVRRGRGSAPLAASFS